MDYLPLSFQRFSFVTWYRLSEIYVPVHVLRFWPSQHFPGLVRDVSTRVIASTLQRRVRKYDNATVECASPHVIFEKQTNYRIWFRCQINVYGTALNLPFPARHLGQIRILGGFGMGCPTFFTTKCRGCVFGVSRL